MCVAAIAWRAHPDWHLVAIGNRDEFHDRPAAAIERWPDDSGIIAGRDLRSGGTWLGVTGQGRFALVTNLRGFGLPEHDKVSRGALVTDTLLAREPADLDAYNPFNLFAVDTDRADYVSNRPEAVRAHLAPGIYGLSNGPFDEPWPKALFLKARLLGWLQSPDNDTAPLMEALASEALPEVGLPADKPSDVPEPRDTPPFIRSPEYGTRCSTVVTVDSRGKGTIRERRFDATATVSGETVLSFSWQL